MSEYRIPGFRLMIPEGAEDHSIIALTLVPEVGLRFATTITRCRLAEGNTLADHVSADIAARESHADYSVAWRKPYSLGGLDGIILAGSFDGPDETIDERRLYVLAKNSILLVEATTPQAFVPSQLDSLNRLVEGLTIDSEHSPEV